MVGNIPDFGCGVLYILKHVKIGIIWGTISRERIPQFDNVGNRKSRVYNQQYTNYDNIF